MKTLENLEIIEQKMDSTTSKKEFFIMDGGPRVNEEYMIPLKHPPVFLTKTYEQFHFLHDEDVPKEATCLLVGEKILEIGRTPREIYPASYYRTIGPPLRGLFKSQKEKP